MRTCCFIGELEGRGLCSRLLRWSSVIAWDLVLVIEFKAMKRDDFFWFLVSLCVFALS